MAHPFQDAAELLDFLETDEPGRYVFRGQTRSYPGPLLPSGARGRFTPFTASSGKPRWAGITKSQSEIADENEPKRQGVLDESVTWVRARNWGTNWELPETAYQSGLRDFFNQTLGSQIRNTGQALKESAVPAIGELLGDDVAGLLCQQYGLTSTALDVTTDLSVAMFFATHEAPFYSPVTDSPCEGVIYRWPRERAMIARDLLASREGPGFGSVTASLQEFIKYSTDLAVAEVTAGHFLWPTGRKLERWHVIVSSYGERRNHRELRFPAGAFNRSRMGTQSAAALWPVYEIVRPLRPKHESDLAVLVGDLMETHQGESFHFRHGGARPPERTDKFALWPSILPTTTCLSPSSGLELEHDCVQFEDLYLEMMLRFFSSCSPCMISVLRPAKPGSRYPIEPMGFAHGVVDLGYLLHPSEARLIADRLRVPQVYTPMPTLRYLLAEHVERFQTSFADAVSL